MIDLRGMSWDHPRGHDSVVATAEAYHATNPNVTITWRTRSLQDFADYPVQKLAEMFDLILIDHPFTGVAATSGCLFPIDDHLDAAFLADQAANSVGKSHQSYIYGGHQWALATDAASQVASYRADLLTEAEFDIPTTWDDVLRLASARVGKNGQVAIPLIPVDTLMSFCSICANHGEEPFVNPDRVVSRQMGRFALDLLLRLRDLIHPESLTFNPIKCYDRMSSTDEISYVPLGFGYSNYARPGFRPRLVRFTNIPRASDGVARGGILGGVGLAVSSTTRHPAAAFDYARFVASPDVQRGLYFTRSGQPGHRAAWLDPAVNEASSNFFLDTLETLDNCYLRPRYLGFMDVQDQGFVIAHSCLTDQRTIEETLDALDHIYQESQQSDSRTH